MDRRADAGVKIQPLLTRAKRCHQPFSSRASRACGSGDFERAIHPALHARSDIRAHQGEMLGRDTTLRQPLAHQLSQIFDGLDPDAFCDPQCHFRRTTKQDLAAIQSAKLFLKGFLKIGVELLRRSRVFEVNSTSNGTLDCGARPDGSPADTLTSRQRRCSIRTGLRGASFRSGGNGRDGTPG